MKAVLGQKMIVDAIDLGWASLASGNADRSFQHGFGRDECISDRRLPGPRWRRQNQTNSAARDFDHSMFCTCSRNCSIAAFSFNPVAVRAGDADLLHNVFASRLNSWIRKSSL